MVGGMDPNPYLAAIHNNIAIESTQSQLIINYLLNQSSQNKKALPSQTHH